MCSYLRQDVREARAALAFLHATHGISPRQPAKETPSADYLNNVSQICKEVAEDAVNATGLKAGAPFSSGLSPQRLPLPNPSARSLAEASNRVEVPLQNYTGASPRPSP